MGKYGVSISVLEDIVVVLRTYSRFAVYWRVLFVPAETTRKFACMNNKRFLPLI